jgi:phosphoribosyl 1,2-cyclic phosphodiesterase
MIIRPFASSSKGNAYLISDGTTQLLLDCGIPFREVQKKTGFRIHEISGCLITHEHGDHASGVAKMAEAGIECFMSDGTRIALGINHHRIQTVRSREPFTIGTWSITPFDVQHDAAEPLGFVMTSNSTGERLLYATDTVYLKYRFSRLTHIMIEANYSPEKMSGIDPAMRHRIVRSHMSIETTKQYLATNDLSKVVEIWLIHLSDGNSDAERFKREVQELTGKQVYIAEAG